MKKWKSLHLVSVAVGVAVGVILSAIVFLIPKAIEYQLQRDIESPAPCKAGQDCRQGFSFDELYPAEAQRALDIKVERQNAASASVKRN